MTRNKGPSTVGLPVSRVKQVLYIICNKVCENMGRRLCSEHRLPSDHAACGQEHDAGT